MSVTAWSLICVTSLVVCAFKISWYAFSLAFKTKSFAAFFSSVVASVVLSIAWFWVVTAWSTSFLAFDLTAVAGCVLWIEFLPASFAVSTPLLSVAAVMLFFASVTAVASCWIAASFLHLLHFDRY